MAVLVPNIVGYNIIVSDPGVEIKLIQFVSKFRIQLWKVFMFIIMLSESKSVESNMREIKQKTSQGSTQVTVRSGGSFAT